MLSHVVLGSALISSSLAVIVAPSAVDPDSPALITPAPQVELLRKQNNDRFMGWVQPVSGIWTSQQCDVGNTFYQSGEYWACCATSRAGCLNMPIGCVSGNMIYRASATASSLSNSLVTRPCTSIWTASDDASYTVCNTGFMFQNSLDSSPKSNIFCGIVSSNWSYYRQQPQTAAASTTMTLSSSIPVISTPPAAPTAPILTSPTPEPKKESKAWIAGAVVGPIVGLALIGLGIFFFMRRKKNKSTNPNLAPATGSVGPAPTAYQQNTGFHADPNNGSQPPQYYPPPMQQNAGAPGFAPVGVQKHESTYFGQPQSPGAQSPNTQSTYGAPQQWQQQGAPSPSMSPVPQHAQPAQYNTQSTAFSSELEGSNAHGLPEVVQVQPKTT